MKKEEIEKIVERQRAYFETGETLDVNFRIRALKKLKKAIEDNEQKINAALGMDLGKSETEAYMCETGLVLSEIGYMIKNAKKLARDEKRKTPIAQFAAKSRVKKSPYGVCLVMSPWNYPFLLTLSPLADALAAGNVAVVKMSAYSAQTARVTAELIRSVFDEKYVAVIEGGREENTHLTQTKFDFVFFTGSKSVGRIVAERAAGNLTPCVLELGGKSPCIVDKSADVKLSAKRIVWGKFLNCGQTCVAPDYVLCHTDVRDEFEKCVKKEIDLQFGEALTNKDYGKIINEKHFDRITALINPEKLVCGGKSNRENLKIEPTVMDAEWDDDVMKDEIFGPLLPILTYEDAGEAVEKIEKRPTPLALYVFTRDKKVAGLFTERCRFGGGCVNDTVVHLATSSMGFGGMGESGMGQYHGKDGFDCFSHKKSIVDKKLFVDLPMRYQPFDKTKKKLIKMFLK